MYQRPCTVVHVRGYSVVPYNVQWYNVLPVKCTVVHVPVVNAQVAPVRSVIVHPDSGLIDMGLWAWSRQSILLSMTATDGPIRRADIRQVHVQVATEDRAKTCI
jgi:hypothetical protein